MHTTSSLCWRIANADAANWKERVYKVASTDAAVKEQRESPSADGRSMLSALDSGNYAGNASQQLSSTHSLYLAPYLLTQVHTHSRIQQKLIIYNQITLGKTDGRATLVSVSKMKKVEVRSERVNESVCVCALDSPDRWNKMLQQFFGCCCSSLSCQQKDVKGKWKVKDKGKCWPPPSSSPSAFLSEIAHLLIYFFISCALRLSSKGAILAIASFLFL